MIETYKPEQLESLKALKNSITTVECLEKLINDYPTVSEMAYTVKGEDHESKVALDWDLVHAVRGAGYGEYLLLRNQGLGEEANEVMLKEGHPQTLTRRQERYLKNWDSAQRQGK